MRAYVVAVKRKDGRPPKDEKIIESQNGEMPLVWHRREEAEKICRRKNDQFLSDGIKPYGVFEVSLEIVGEA